MNKKETKERLLPFWRNYCAVILECNRLLELGDKCEVKNPELAQIFFAGGLFIRSRAIEDLNKAIVTIFGPKTIKYYTLIGIRVNNVDFKSRE